MPTIARGIGAMILAAFVTGCGGAGGNDGGAPYAANQTPRATAQTFAGVEDAAITGVIDVVDPDGDPVTFAVTSHPANGRLVVDSKSGQFSFVPDPDFFGTDAFEYTVSDGRSLSGAATATLRVSAVNDAPEVDAIPASSNSPNSDFVRVPYRVTDVDSADLQVTVSIGNSEVASATLDSAVGAIILRSGNRGNTQVVLHASDGEHVVEVEFDFTVQDVVKDVRLASQYPGSDAVVLTNSGPTTDFELTHNGHLAFSSMEQIVAAVQALPSEQPGEPFERKLWRFVRDNTYHDYPVNDQRWMNATWPTLNSLGWGFCTHVAAVFLKIAEAAGYPVRIWRLTGHGVPEIFAGGRWQMFDPDLGVYYFNRAGSVASVAELEADPGLISSPVNPIFAPGEDRGAYGADVAAIYGSTANNFTDNPEVSDEPFQSSRVTLPAGARLIYPGIWTAAPIGYEVGDPTAHPVHQFRQARLDVPEGITGIIATPWVPWDVQGSGRVRILGDEYSVGTAAIGNRLVAPGQSITSIEILDNPAGLAIIMMINPLWYDVLATNAIALSGTDVWSIVVDRYPLAPGNRPPPPVPVTIRHPRP
jgi:Bacterial Ig domain